MAQRDDLVDINAQQFLADVLPDAHQRFGFVGAEAFLFFLAQQFDVGDQPVAKKAEAVFNPFG